MSKFGDDFIQYSDKKVKNETKGLTAYFFVTIPLYIVLLFFLIFFVWYTVFISTHSFYAVSGPSMKNTLNSEVSDVDPNTSYDAVYIDRSTKARMFDIIVIDREGESSVIKRLMAVEGDYITIAKGTTEEGNSCWYFYRIPNGTDLETFTDEQARLNEESGENGYSIRGYDSWYQQKNAETLLQVTVDGQEYSNTYEQNFYDHFLMGYSSQSQDYFTSANGLVYVKVPKGKIFYMGDNRGFSKDARVNGFGEFSSIVGRAEFIVYDYNFGNRLWEVVKFYFREMEKFFAR